MRAQEQDREEVAQARARWENDQKKIPAAKLGSVLNWKLIRLENWRRVSRMKRYGLRDDPWERIKGL